MQSIRPFSPVRRRAFGLTLAVIGLLVIAPQLVTAQNPKAVRILFASNRDGDKRFNIFTMNPDGAEPVNLTKTSAMEFDAATVSSRYGRRTGEMEGDKSIPH